MMNFNNMSSLTNVRCCFSLHQNEIILEFLSSWWISTICHHSPTSDVVFLFIKMRRFQNFFHHAEFQQCFIIDQRPMFFFYSSEWDHFRIPSIMMNFNNISSFTNVGCCFAVHQNEITLGFFWRWWISGISHHWGVSDVGFLFIKMKSF